MNKYPQFWLYRDTVARFDEAASGGVNVTLFNPATEEFSVDGGHRAAVIEGTPLPGITRPLTESELSATLAGMTTTA